VKIIFNKYKLDENFSVAYKLVITKNYAFIKRYFITSINIREKEFYKKKIKIEVDFIDLEKAMMFLNDIVMPYIKQNYEKS